MVKKKIIEFFKVFKKGKEKLIKKESTKNIKEKSSKKQVKEENKILRNVFITLGVIILFIFLSYLSLYNSNNFEYKGIKFDVMKLDGGTRIYHTSFPATLDREDVNYNVYIRNDPRKLEKDIPFSGKMYLPEIFVLNTTENLNCDGDGQLGIFNLQQVMKVFDSQFITDPEASCDPQGRYGYVKLQTGDISAVAQFGGPSCYILQVNDCEILKVTERFLVEGLVKGLGE